ncbi:MAG TPA: hypothetical protein ENG22_04255 [Candidatus Bathyarchaeota archaeon]|nr:hypothetical protein [Candidatus Bathyarchaeota archaeon]
MEMLRPISFLLITIIFSTLFIPVSNAQSIDESSYTIDITISREEATFRAVMVISFNWSPDAMDFIRNLTMVYNTSSSKLNEVIYEKMNSTLKQISSNYIVKNALFSMVELDRESKRFMLTLMFEIDPSKILKDFYNGTIMIDVRWRSFCLSFTTSINGVKLDFKRFTIFNFSFLSEPLSDWERIESLNATEFTLHRQLNLVIDNTAIPTYTVSKIRVYFLNAYGGEDDIVCYAGVGGESGIEWIYVLIVIIVVFAIFFMLGRRLSGKETR